MSAAKKKRAPKKSAIARRRDMAQALAARLVGRVYEQIESTRGDLRKLAQDARDACDLAALHAKEFERAGDTPAAHKQREHSSFHDGRSVGLEVCASVLQAMLARRVA